MSSSDGGTITKRCVICGADCDGQPRVKDPRGRYYHRQCHAEAAEQHARGRRSAATGGAAATAPAATRATAPPDEPDAPLIEVLGGTADGGGDDWLDALPRTEPCGGCGRPLAVGAALCTSCGHQAGGGTLSTRKLKAAREPRASRTSTGAATEWLPFLVVPTLVGLVAAVMIVGGGEDLGFLGTIAMWGVSLVAGIWTLVAAWQRSALVCLGVLLGNVFLLGIPGLVFVFFFQEDRRLKAMMGGAFLGMMFAGAAVGWTAASTGADPDSMRWMP